MHSPDPAAAQSFTPRPEQTFFADAAIDRAMGVIMRRDRQFALERLLAAQGVVDVAELDAEPAAAEAAAAAADREAFVAHLMSSVLGMQESTGMTP